MDVSLSFLDISRTSIFKDTPNQLNENCICSYILDVVYKVFFWLSHIAMIFRTIYFGLYDLRYTFDFGLELQISPPWSIVMP